MPDKRYFALTAPRCASSPFLLQTIHGKGWHTHASFHYLDGGKLTLYATIVAAMLPAAGMPIAQVGDLCSPEATISSVLERVVPVTPAWEISPLTQRPS